MEGNKLKEKKSQQQIVLIGHTYLQTLYRSYFISQLLVLLDVQLILKSSNLFKFCKNYL